MLLVLKYRTVQRWFKVICGQEERKVVQGRQLGEMIRYTRYKGPGVEDMSLAQIALFQQQQQKSVLAKTALHALRGISVSSYGSISYSFCVYIPIGKK